MSLYDSVRDLPLTVEGYALDGARAAGLERFPAQDDRGPAQRRRRGRRRRGRHLRRDGARPPAGARPSPSAAPASGRSTRSRSISERCAVRPRARAARLPRLSALGLRERRARPRAPSGGPIARRRRRTLAEPLTFVVSMRLGEPATTDRLHAWLELYPGLRFKLDATARLVGRADRRARGHGGGRLGRLQGPVPRHERRHGPRCRRSTAVSSTGLPDAWLEDPALTPETVAVLEPHSDRVTWDAVIHSVADIEALRWPPRTVNVKPSRFGSVERLFARVRLLRRERDRRLRRRSVRARRRARSDPVARGALPSRDAERRRTRWVQPRSPARAPESPLTRGRPHDRVRGRRLRIAG